MLLYILLMTVGLALILAGANFMTSGSAALAKRLGMSDFLVGLTVVSMMTSAPELVVSITSACSGATSMAIGNIVGSNIFNILVIVGLCAVLTPIKVERGVLINEIPIALLSAVVLLVMGSSQILDDTPMELSRVDGILLLIFFIIFMRYTLASAKKAPASDPVSEDGARQSQMPLWKSLLYCAGGLAALIFGGNLFVDNASGLARTIGWSEGLIGLTILAAGTSLPELATSMVAAWKGMSGICIGNVIGSNIFNIFFVLGTASTIKPLAFGSISMLDLVVLVGASVLFWLSGWFIGKRTITRIEGAAMVLLYVAYTAYLILSLPA